MSERNDFRKTVESIVHDDKEEMSKIIARLKLLTPEEFLRLPRREVERLSLTQYAEIARAIAPGVELGASRPEREPETPKKRRSWTIRQRSLATVAASVVLASGVALAGPTVNTRLAETSLVRPVSIWTWPTCTRMTNVIDGCVYVPQQNLTWDYVAYMLGMDRLTLRTLNHDLPETHAPVGEKIIVWRGLGRLES